MTPLRTIKIAIPRLCAPFTALALALGVSSCEDTVPEVGSSLATGEVQIALDSLVWDGTRQYIYRGNDSTLVTCPKIEYITEFCDTIDSRSTTNLIGRLSVPEYGDLHCSFVSQLMSATSLAIPDSIPLEQIDSMKMILSVPRGELTGDSLAPQRLQVYRLTKSLPKNISSKFDPTSYYSTESLIGSNSYTLSALGMSDSIYSALSYISIDIPLSRDMARDIVTEYRTNPSTFAWPESFENKFKGIYVEPSFGRGCVANVAQTDVLIYYSYKALVSVTETDDDGNETTTQEEQTKTGAVGVFESSPIVLSSNNINYEPSASLKAMAAANEPIITTPGGYRVKMRFPAKELIDIYSNSHSRLSVVSGLTFTIPVEEIENDYGLTPPPYMLMVKTSKLKEFLETNPLPDSKDSFYAAYSSTSKSYTFSSMRNYILGLIENGYTDEDLDFTLIPANLTLESDSSDSSYYYYYYYGYSSSSSSTYTVTKCTPYITKPSMCKLLMDKAQTIFTYSTQQKD